MIELLCYGATLLAALYFVAIVEARRLDRDLHSHH